MKTLCNKYTKIREEMGWVAGGTQGSCVGELPALVSSKDRNILRNYIGDSTDE